MKAFKSVRVIDVGIGFIAIKEKVDELWLTPEDEMKFIQTWDLSYALREMMEDKKEETNAAE